MDQIREKLKLLQIISGKTQMELASILDVTPLAFSNWYNGKSMPRKNTLKKIEKTLSDYGIVSNEETPSPTNLKKNTVLEIAKKNKNILKKILTRSDLIDELSLHITYNSNAIEGSTLTREDTKNIIFENKVLGNKTLIEQLEAKNHDKAFRYLLQALASKEKINESLTKKLHKILLAGIRDDAGIYRAHGVRIVGSYVSTANYIKIPDLIKKLFGSRRKGDIIEFAANFHASFEKIHPFTDGNGRIGRLLLIGMLLEQNIAPAIIIKKRRPEYYKALRQAQLHENENPLLEFISEAILEGYKIILG